MNECRERDAVLEIRNLTKHYAAGRTQAGAEGGKRGGTEHDD